MTMATESATFLSNFTLRLKERDALPKRIEISEVGATILANSLDEERTETISEFIYTGMDADPSVAVLKSLVERAERFAFSNGYRKRLNSCLTERSDGFAAYPRGIVERPEEFARRNGFEEAVERYAWATWWDKPEVGHTTSVIGRNDTSVLSRNLLEQIDRHVAVDQIKIVEPKIDRKQGLSVKIYFLFLRPFGVVSGGACGPTKHSHKTEYRALCELYRHAVAVSRMLKTNYTPSLFYEKRLFFFGTTNEGQETVKNRLLANGSESIFLPRLAIDESVPHPLDDLIAVHRCYFENQPPFVGGKLERMCI